MKLFRRGFIIAIVMTFIVTGFCFQSNAEVYDKPVTKGWNLVSLPANVSDNHYLSVFPGAVEGTLWGYENGVYVDKETLELGEAYWLRFPEENTALIDGNPIFSLTINLEQGWNMISGISVDVPLSEIIDPENIIIPGTLYEFNGSLVPSDIIETGKGYWIRASAAGQITLSGSFVIDGDGHEISTSSGALMTIEDTGGGQLNVSMTDLQQNEIQQTYGVIPDLFIDPFEIHRFRFSPDESYTGGSVNIELQLPSDIFPNSGQKVVVFSNKVENAPEFENNVDIWDAVEDESHSIFLSFEILSGGTDPVEFDIGLAVPEPNAQEFTGTIVDTLDNPVKDAHVYHLDTNVRAITRQDGNFILYVENASSQLNYKMAKSSSPILLASLDVPLSLLTAQNSSEMLMTQLRGASSIAWSPDGGTWVTIAGSNLRNILRNAVFDDDPCKPAQIDLMAALKDAIENALKQEFSVFDPESLELTKSMQNRRVKITLETLITRSINNLVVPDKRYLAQDFLDWVMSIFRLKKDIDAKKEGKITVKYDTFNIGFPEPMVEVKEPAIAFVPQKALSHIWVQALEGGETEILLANPTISASLTFTIQKKSGVIECEVESQSPFDNKFANPLKVTVIPHPGNTYICSYGSVKIDASWGLSDTVKNWLLIHDDLFNDDLPKKLISENGELADQEDIYGGEYSVSVVVRDVPSEDVAELIVQPLIGDITPGHGDAQEIININNAGYNPKLSHAANLTFYKETGPVPFNSYTLDGTSGNLFFEVPYVKPDYWDEEETERKPINVSIQNLQGKFGSKVIYEKNQIGWFIYDPTFIRIIDIEKESEYFTSHPEFSSEFHQELTHKNPKFDAKELCGIQLPITGSIVRGDVPIFGYFHDSSSKGYRIEYGKGVTPDEWSVLDEGNTTLKPITSHDIRLFSMERSVEGNLATWPTGLRGYNYGPPKDYLEGVYSVRLCKLTDDEPVEQQRILLRLGSVVANALGRKIISDDGKISLTVAPHSLPYPAELFYIEKLKNKESSNPFLSDYLIIGPPTLNAGVVLGVEKPQEEIIGVEQIDIETGEPRELKKAGEEFLINGFGNAGSVFRIHCQQVLQTAEMPIGQESERNDSSISEELNFLDFEEADIQKLEEINQLNSYLAFDFSKGKDSSQALRITNEKTHSPFKVNLPFRNFDADSLPLLEFDYKMEGGSQVDLYITVNGKNYVIGMFSGEPKFSSEVNIFPVDALHSYEKGTQWQHARIDLARILRKNGYFNSDSKLIVENVFLAGLEGGSFMQLYPLPNPKGASITLDNMYLGPFLNSAHYRTLNKTNSLQNVSIDDTAPVIEITNIEKMASGESFAIQDTILVSFADLDGSALDEKSVRIKLNDQPLPVKLHYKESDAHWVAEIALQEYCSDNEKVSLRISDVKDRAGNMADETVVEFTFRPDLDRTPPTAPKLVLPSQHEISNQIQAFYCISSDENPIAQYQWRLLTQNGEYSFTTLEPVKTFDFSGLNGTDLTVFLKATDANGNESPESRFDFVINVLGRKKLDLQSPTNIFSPREAGDFLAQIENLENKGISIKVQDVTHAAYATIEYAVESDFIVGNNDLFISGNYRGNANIANIYLEDSQSRFFVDLENYIDVGENEDFYVSIPLKDFVVQGLKLEETRKLSITFEWENIEGSLNIYEMGFENNLEKHSPVKLVECVGQ